MRIAIIVGVVLAALVVVWVFWGRFAVEGGRARWAVVNDRLDVLEEALKENPDANTKRDCLARAITRRNPKAAKLLVAAGASPNPPARGFCMLASAARWGDVEAVAMMLEAGADPHLCDAEDAIVSDLVQYGADRAPQAELVRVLKLLIAKGAPYQKGAAMARTRKLDQVAAFLDNPAAAPQDDGPTVRLARAGSGGKVDWGDFKSVCAGKGLASLPAYQKQKEAVSPVVTLEQRGDKIFFPDGPESILPRWWTADDDLRHTQVVACAKVVDKKVVRECHYEGGGGGVTIYDATYELSLREGRTATVLATRTVPLRAATDHCDLVKFGENQEGVYPKYAAELATLVGPLIGAP